MPVLDSSTTEGLKAELTWVAGYVPRWLFLHSPIQVVTVSGQLILHKALAIGPRRGPGPLAAQFVMGVMDEWATVQCRSMCFSQKEQLDRVQNENNISFTLRAVYACSDVFVTKAKRNIPRQNEFRFSPQTFKNISFKIRQHSTRAGISLQLL